MEARCFAHFNIDMNTTSVDHVAARIHTSLVSTHVPMSDGAISQHIVLRSIITFSCDQNYNITVPYEYAHNTTDVLCWCEAQLESIW